MLYEQKLAEETAELEGDRDEPKCPRCDGWTREHGTPCDDCVPPSGVRIVERPDGAHEFRVPTAYDVDRANVDEMIDQLLRLSMRHANDATDPDTPEGHFRHHCAQSVLAAQAAHALERLLACAGSKEAASTAAEMREFGQDSEVLVSWVGERLSTRES